jgi:hypothetical protein
VPAKQLSCSCGFGGAAATFFWVLQQLGFLSHVVKVALSYVVLPMEINPVRQSGSQSRLFTLGYTVYPQQTVLLTYHTLLHHTASVLSWR